MSELRLVWRYRPWPDKVEEFERTYGADGAWADFFRRSTDFLGTELYRDTEVEGHYLVVDRWRSAGGQNYFMETFGSEYATLSAETAELHMEETRVGAYELVA